MEKKHKHLDYIQSVINRLASNSFLIKGWGVTIISALVVLLKYPTDAPLMAIIFAIPIVCFWLLDGYYLWQERLFRNLYNSVVEKDEVDIDYKMVPIKNNTYRDSYWGSLFSFTIMILYVPLFILTSLVILLRIS